MGTPTSTKTVRKYQRKPPYPPNEDPTLPCYLQTCFVCKEEAKQGDQVGNDQNYNTFRRNLFFVIHTLSVPFKVLTRWPCLKKWKNKLATINVEIVSYFLLVVYAAGPCGQTCTIFILL